MAVTAQSDILGADYECRTIDLGTDDEGPVVATLVRRRPVRPTGRAVLHIHGFADYFFQTHLADFFVNRGWDFFAIDLRKCGRSLLPHQTPHFCHDVSDYYVELDAAAKIIKREHGNQTLLVIGHSTGGLIAALWAHARRATGLIDGLVLNSPFFDFNVPWITRRPLIAVVSRLARLMPYRTLPKGRHPVYGQSLHVEHRGEWRYDLNWKPIGGFPVRLGWIAAIHRAQRRLRAGLAIPVPVLLVSSTRSFRGTTWHGAAMAADAVLNVEHMARWAPNLGRQVSLIRFDGGLHDVTLSRPAVRSKVFAELERWINSSVASTGAPTAWQVEDRVTPTLVAAPSDRASVPAQPVRTSPAAAGGTEPDSAPAPVADATPQAAANAAEAATARTGTPGARGRPLSGPVPVERSDEAAPIHPPATPANPG